MLRKYMKRNKSTHLYILSCGTRVKIGVTSNIDKRVKALQTGNAEKIKVEYIEERNNPTKAERFLHKCFHKRRLVGEWFEDLTVYEIRSRLMLFFDQD